MLGLSLTHRSEVTKFEPAHRQLAGLRDVHILDGACAPSGILIDCATASGMAAKHQRYVARTGPLPRPVEEEVAAGLYISASEVVRTGLRLLDERKDFSSQSATKDG